MTLFPSGTVHPLDKPWSMFPRSTLKIRNHFPTCLLLLFLLLLTILLLFGWLSTFSLMIRGNECRRLLNSFISEGHFRFCSRKCHRGISHLVSHYVWFTVFNQTESPSKAALGSFKLSSMPTIEMFSWEDRPPSISRRNSKSLAPSLCVVSRFPISWLIVFRFVASHSWGLELNFWLNFCFHSWPYLDFPQ